MTFDLTSTKLSTLFRSTPAPLFNQTEGGQNRQVKFEPTAAQTLRALSQMNAQQRYDAYWNISCDPLEQKKVKMELAERYFIYDDPCEGMALLNYIARRNGWKNIINMPGDYRMVGILHDRNPENAQGHDFPPGKVFALELSDRLGNVLFSRNYVPLHQNNCTESWHFNILEQISRAMPVSGLESKNYLHLAAITATSYNSTTPHIESGYVDSPCRNLFLVKKESDVYDVAWRIIDPEPIAVAHRSVWLTQAAEKKPFGYRQSATHLANEIMHIAGNKSQTTGQTEAVLALLSRRINDGTGKWLNDFKGFLNHWLERKTKINDVLNSTVTATYYESIKAQYPTLRGTARSTASAINPLVGSLLESLNYDEKTSSQSLWRFLQQRKNFFEPREIQLDGVPSIRFRSGARLTFEENFQRVRFASPAASNSSLIRECVNHPAVLRSAWESYIDALFADDRYLSAYLNVMDLSLAATLDRVINGQYPQYLTLDTTQRQAYAQQAEAIRLGKPGALLLQHNGEEDTLADRLILIGGARPHDYLACSVSLGNKVFHTITLTPDGNNLRVHDDVVDFLQDFFPGNSLMKTQRLAVPTPERTRPVEMTLREGFSLVENSNPVVALVEAHKDARKRVAKQLANSAEETAELNKVRFYDRLAEIATDVTLVIPLAEPLALEALVIEGVTKTIVEEGLQVTGKVINAASLALPVVAQWQRYSSAVNHSLQAQREFIQLTETLEINLLLAAPHFLPAASEETRYRQAKAQVQARSDTSDDLPVCRTRRSLWPTLCTEASAKATKFAERYTTSMRQDVMLKSCWDFVIDIQRKAGMITPQQALQLLKTRSNSFQDFIGKDALLITSTAQLKAIPLGARLAFIAENGPHQQAMNHAMIYLKEGRAVGVSNQWLTTHLDFYFSSVATQIDLHTDLRWGMAGPLNSEGQPVKLYAQSMQDIRKPVLMSELLHEQELHTAPTRKLKAITLSDSRKSALMSDLAAGMYPNHLTKSYFLRGSHSLNAWQRQTLTEILTLVKGMPDITLQEAATLFHGDAITVADSIALKAGDLLQSHQLTFFSPEIYVASYFKQFAEKEVKVIYRLPVASAGSVGKLDVLPLHYTRIKNHYRAANLNHAADAAQGVKIEGVIPPGQIFRVVNIGEQRLARQSVKVIELEYMLREEKILARSFNGMDYTPP
ncbi:hypothetical protein [Candidatus Pantoea multigeneris]|uniref:Uncharacterized protein n=1 Tax=Candidatus Pantoea multigeneris TaxID=2608357 RepID=A0ABX0R8Q1_9GAMM|nr:hypothetical protein [Pantoea multigeneris]NIF21154.1 hypothetical protein [Pantoea multigeneris]